MVLGFTSRHPDWKDVLKERKDDIPALRKERETERLVLVAWLEAGAPRGAYEKDAFALPDALAERPLHADLKTVAVRDDAPAAPAKPPVRSAKSKQMSVESLTQSTHAHLLSFAVLYLCTGLVLAFSSYPGWIRGILAPLVLFAQIADIACWWLARLDGVGPYFAVAILGTGAVVG